MNAFGTAGFLIRLFLLALTGSFATLGLAGLAEVSADGSKLVIDIDLLAALIDKWWVGLVASGGTWFAWWRAASRRPEAVK